MGTEARTPRVCVVGSSIIDLVAYAPRLPHLGETLPGSRFDTGFGGKGANQAVMAAKLGAHVSMVSKVGSDTFGDDYLRNFADAGVDHAHVSRSTTASTGVAPIWVDETTGANQIIVVLGANAELTDDDVHRAAGAIRGADVVVCQWEVPIGAVRTAFAVARAAGVRTVFNPAPVQGGLPDDLWPLVDVFCPNEHEAHALTGRPVATLDEATAAARTLLARGVGAVVLTLGERGALVVDAAGATAIDAPVVQAVDTTGAGDAFVGTLAVRLAEGRSLVDAARDAIAVASDSVTRLGTQKSYRAPAP